MRITKIETIRLTQHPQLLWVQVHTDAGLTGLGETFYVPGAVAAVIHDVAAPVLLGEDPLDIERHWHALFQITNYYGYAGAEMRAVSALDIALWDIAGQATGQPIHKLLGGTVRDRIRVYNTCASFGAIDDFTAFHERPAELAQSLLDMGINAMKIWPFDRLAAPAAGRTTDDRFTVGPFITAEQVAQGLEPVRRIREAVGSKMEIAIELHGRWSLPSAIRIARALEPYDVMWFEEALTPDPVDDLTRLVQEISEGKKIAAMAEAYHLPIAPHDCSGPVNVFACAHLCANCPNVMIMETVRAFYRGYYDEIITPNVDVHDGHLMIPTTPGLGTRLRPEVRDRADARIQVSA
jgi:galactonate dehydratase